MSEKKVTKKRRFVTFTVAAPEGARQAIIRAQQDANTQGIKFLTSGKHTASPHATGRGYMDVKLEVK